MYKRVQKIDSERTVEAKAPREEPPYPLTQILEIATDMGVDDLSILLLKYGDTL